MAGDYWRGSVIPDMYGEAACREGCQLARARVLLEQARSMLDTAQRMTGRTPEGEITMTAALWCDEGDHPFSARDSKAERWERHLKDDDGKEVIVVWDVCSKHLRRGNSGAASLPAGGSDSGHE